MSTGSIIGAVVGGVIGFFMGGPMGAIYGAGMGFSLGMMLDPINPDKPTAGNPNIDEVVLSSQIGIPLKDVLGTGKVTGHLLCYGKERVVEKTETVDSGGGKGGGGGTTTYTTGYEYYMTWAVGICKGPVQYLYSVYSGEDLVWSGRLRIPASGGQETITLDGLGSCIFYFGSDDQVANSIVNDLIPDSTLNSPWRNFCWALLDDCLIGKYSPRTPTLKFIVGKYPVLDFSFRNKIDGYDYNPAHAVWYILVNLCGLPEEWCNVESFNNSAYTLYIEKHGVSLVFTTNQSALSYLTSVNTHIDGYLHYDNNGKFVFKLFRDDYDVDVLPSIDENNMLEDPEFKRDSWIATTNEIKIQYSELDDNIYIKDYTYYLSVGGPGYGELGLGDTTIRIFPSLSMFPKSWVMISSGGQYTVGLGEDGSVWGWGLNSSYSELGQGVAAVSYKFPIKLMDGVFVSIACGGSCTILVREDGHVFGVGRNNYALLGLGHASPVVSFTLIFTSSGTEKVIKAVCSSTHSILLMGSGGTYGTGINSYGQLGLGYTSTIVYSWTAGTSFGIDDIVVGSAHTCATKGNKVYTCGRNVEGQLGLGDYAHRDEFTIVTVPMGLNVLAVACNVQTTYIINGAYVWATGSNNGGQLGLGPGYSKVNEFHRINQIETKLIAAMGSIIYAVATETGSIYTCGSGSTLDGAPWGFYLEEKPGYDIGEMFASVSSTCLFLKFNSDVQSQFIFGTGAGTVGQFGFTLNKYVFVSTYTFSKNVLQHSVKNYASYSTCIITEDNKLLGTGANTNGQLGLGDSLNRYDYEQIGTKTNWKYINTSSKSMYCINSSNELWATGTSTRYCLGFGDTITRTVLTKLGTDQDWVEAVCSGGDFSFYRKFNGEIYVVGYNTDGQLGLEDNVLRENLTLLSSVPNVTQISLGVGFSALLDSNGDLWTCGDNYYGQLGDTTNIDRNFFSRVNTEVAYVSCGSNFIAVLKKDGSIETVGNNTSGQLGNGSFANRVTEWQSVFVGPCMQVASGSGFTLILKSDGSIWGTGVGSSIGKNSAGNVNEFIQEAFEGYNWIDIGAGNNFSTAICSIE